MVNVSLIHVILSPSFVRKTFQAHQIGLRSKTEGVLKESGCEFIRTPLGGSGEGRETTIRRGGLYHHLAWGNRLGQEETGNLGESKDGPQAELSSSGVAAAASLPDFCSKGQHKYPTSLSFIPP